MKKSKMILLPMIVIILLLSPKTINLIKNKINKSSLKIEEIKEISFQYGSDISFLNYRQGFLIYDGKSLKYIDNKAERIFSLNIRIDNYSIDVTDGNIYLLDKTKKEIYIIDKKGSIVNKIGLKENPLFVKGIKNSYFLVHYNTNVEVEGLKIMNQKGEEIKDISIPKITINFIDVDKDTGGFLISGINTEKDSLVNAIFYYDKKGNLEFSDNIENKLFIKSLFLDHNIILVEPQYIEIKDKEFKTSSNLNLDNGIRDVHVMEDGIDVVDNTGKLIAINEKGQEKEQSYPIGKIKGVEEIKNERIVYSDRSIYFSQYKQKQDFTKDIIKILVLDDESVIVVFRGSIKFLRVH